jgi:hypothetical protein
MLNSFLASKDFISRNGFAFFDLPAGEYTVSIEADGYKPSTTVVKVQPGEFNPPPPFRLVLK